MILDNLKVVYKLLLVVVVAAVAMIAISFSGYHALGNAGRSMDDMYQHEMQAVQHLGSAVEQSRVIQVKTLQMILVKDNAKRLASIQHDDEQAMDALAVELSASEEALTDNSEAASLLGSVKKDQQVYQAVMVKTKDMALGGQQEAALALYEKDGAPAMVKLRDDLKNLQNRVDTQAAALNQANDAANHQAGWSIIAITVLALALQTIVSLGNAKSITGALNAMVRLCGRLKDGNFVQQPRQLLRHDEFGHMADVLTEARDRIGSYMADIDKVTKEMGTSAASLKDTSMQSAQAAAQSAEAVGESAGLVEDQQQAVARSLTSLAKMRTSIEDMRRASGMVNKNSAAAQQEAMDGSTALEKSVGKIQAVTGMVTDSVGLVDKLGQRSQEIGQIVATISSIADQTNLLALNAAIEAARAGEAGRGFAVVADSVRKLAEQSQEAAEQIAGLITSMQQETQTAVQSMDAGQQAVVAGASSVEELKAVFERIVQMVAEEAERIKEMDIAIRTVMDDAAGISTDVTSIEQHGKGVSAHMQSISAVTEEQSASAEEIASASDTLAGMADKQATALQKFKF
jgi:methyl-accepting chemotaxis protein